MQRRMPLERHRGCECGGRYRLCTEYGIDPYDIYMDDGDAWYAGDAFICDKCGAHLLPPVKKKLNN